MPRLTGLAVVLAAALAVACDNDPPTPETQPRRVEAMPSLAPVAERALPAIVNISVMRESPLDQHPLLDDPELRRHFALPETLPGEELEAVGSGVVVDGQAGHVLTNSHVIEGASQVSVTLSDGSTLEVTKILADPGTDLALLQIALPSGVQIPSIGWGDPSLLQPGDHVVAVGSPFGLDQSVSAGVVSATGRTGLGLQGYENFIQTDASVNPGSSGGALLNLRGELVGINNVILSPSGGSIGISFAIPADTARFVVDQLLATGEVRRGRLGALVRDLSPLLRRDRSLQDAQGVLVVEVAPGSAAATAGLRQGDVISALDGEPVGRAGQLRNQIAFESLGQQVQLTVHRDGERLQLAARIEPAVEETPATLAQAALDNAQGAVPW